MLKYFLFCLMALSRALIITANSNKYQALPERMPFKQSDIIDLIRTQYSDADFTNIDTLGLCWSISHLVAITTNEEFNAFRTSIAKPTTINNIRTRYLAFIKFLLNSDGFNIADRYQGKLKDEHSLSLSLRNGSVIHFFSGLHMAQWLEEQAYSLSMTHLISPINLTDEIRKGMIHPGIYLMIMSEMAPKRFIHAMVIDVYNQTFRAFDPNEGIISAADFTKRDSDYFQSTPFTHSLFPFENQKNPMLSIRAPIHEGAIESAVEAGDLIATEQLLKENPQACGPNLSTKIEDITSFSLYKAASQENKGVPLLRLLVIHGNAYLNLDQKNNEGFSALSVAARLGFYNNVAYLVQAGADVNSANFNNVRPVHMAAQNGHDEVIKILCQKPEIEIDALTDNLLTAFHVAILNHQTATAKLLLLLGANPTLLAYNKITPLELAKRNQMDDLAIILEDCKPEVCIFYTNKNSASINPMGELQQVV